jgi:pimeloyl-ACP methyl ester carboxylesterase
MPSLQTSDGRTLAWRESGSGPPLLCHSGGPGASAAYFGALDGLAVERTLLLLDPRGTGRSDRPGDPSSYALEDYAADIEALRAELGLETLDVLGHSHGGFVAITWAGTYPDRVGRLVLAGTTPRFTDAIRALRRERVGAHAGQPYFADAMAALQEQQAGRYASDAELAELYERAGPVLVPVGGDVTPIAAAFRSAGINADAMRHFNEHIAATMDLRPLLARITAPTLVITGEIDPFGGSTSEEIAAALAQPTVVTIPGADHFPFLEDEHRAAWSRAIVDFLAGRPGLRSSFE